MSRLCGACGPDPPPSHPEGRHTRPIDGALGAGADVSPLLGPPGDPDAPARAGRRPGPVPAEPARGGFEDGPEPLVLQVLQPERERVEPEPAGQLVHLRLAREVV